MNNLAALLRQQGKLAEAGRRSFGVRGDLSGRFTKGTFCFGLDFLFVSWYCWMIFGRTNAHLFTRMNVGHGWKPNLQNCYFQLKLTTQKFGQINDMQMKKAHLENWQPTKTMELMLIC